MTISLNKVYCPYCAGRTRQRYAEGLSRAWCPACDRILYENPVPATCVVLHSGGQILLVKRKFAPRAGEWCLPGGFMELEEQPAEAALRELAEETGLKGRITRFLGALATPGAIYSGLLILGYAAEIIQGEPIPGDDALEVVWFDQEELPPVAFDSHAEFIRRVLADDQSQAGSL